MNPGQTRTGEERCSLKAASMAPGTRRAGCLTMLAQSSEHGTRQACGRGVQPCSLKAASMAPGGGGGPTMLAQSSEHGTRREANHARSKQRAWHPGACHDCHCRRLVSPTRRGVKGMAVLHLQDVPLDVYQRLQRLATAHQRTPEVDAADPAKPAPYRSGRPFAGRTPAELSAVASCPRLVPPTAWNCCARIASDDRDARGLRGGCQCRDQARHHGSAVHTGTTAPAFPW